MSFSYKKWEKNAKNGGPTKVLELADEAANWLKVREDEGSKIDPKTVELYYDYGRDSDPYNLYLQMPPWARDPEEREHAFRDYAYRKIHLARNPNSEILVTLELLPEEIRRDILRQHQELDHGEIPFIRDLAEPIRPVRYYRRCSTMHGSVIVNCDTSRRGNVVEMDEEWGANSPAAASTINPETADVCRGFLSGEPSDDWIYFYRNPENGIWVPEVDLGDKLNDMMRRRIKRKHIRVLWMAQCDD
jgi:hypothetical protein